MLKFLLLVASVAPADVHRDMMQRLINDKVLYGGYGSYGGCDLVWPVCGAPRAPYYGTCYGPALMTMPLCRTEDPLAGINKRIDELKCSTDKLADCLLNLEKRVDKTQKANKKRFKALEEKIKGVDASGKETDKELKSLTKKLEDQSRAAEIKGLEDKIRKLEDGAKTQQIQENFSSSDRLRNLESKLGALESIEAKRDSNDRKRDETIIQFIDQKIDRMQNALKRDVDGVNEHLRRVDEQLRDDKDSRQRIIDRLQQLERSTGVQPPPAPPANGKPAPRRNKADSSEELDRLNEKLPDPKSEAEPKDVRRKVPQMQLAAISQHSADLPTNKAMLIIAVPADARLYLNGKLTQSKGNLRTYFTPVLEKGAQYSYTVRIDLVRNGERLSQSKRVVFRAGNQVQVTFQQPGLQTASR